MSNVNNTREMLESVQSFESLVVGRYPHLFSNPSLFGADVFSNWGARMFPEHDNIPPIPLSKDDMYWAVDNGMSLVYVPGSFAPYQIGQEELVTLENLSRYATSRNKYGLVVRPTIVHQQGKIFGYPFAKNGPRSGWRLVESETCLRSLEGYGTLAGLCSGVADILRMRLGDHRLPEKIRFYASISLTSIMRWLTNIGSSQEQSRFRDCPTLQFFETPIETVMRIWLMFCLNGKISHCDFSKCILSSEMIKFGLDEGIDELGLIGTSAVYKGDAHKLVFSFSHHPVKSLSSQTMFDNVGPVIFYGI